MSGKSLKEVNWAKVGVSALSGGVSAAVPGGFITAAVIGGTTDVAFDMIDGNINSVGDAVKSFAWGAVKEVVSQGVGKALDKGIGKLAGKFAGKSGSNANPYAYLEDGPNVGVGKNFTAAQKQKMLEENMKRNGGVVKSDNPNDFFEILIKPQKSQKGVTPSPNEWQFDHIIPKSKGGTNSYSNCQIVSRKFNRQKWNN